MSQYFKAVFLLFFMINLIDSPLVIAGREKSGAQGEYSAEFGRSETVCATSADSRSAANPDLVESQLEDLCQTATRIVVEDLVILDRMLTDADQMARCGAQTLETLAEQGAKLKRIRHQLIGVSTSVQQAAADLGKMSGCFGWEWPWSRRARLREKARWQTEQSRFLADLQDEAQDAKDTMAGIVSHHRFECSTEVTEDERQRARLIGEELESRINAGIAELQQRIGTLKQMALEMSAELDSQDRSIDGLRQAATASAGHVRAADARAAQQL